MNHFLINNLRLFFRLCGVTVTVTLDERYRYVTSPFPSQSPLPFPFFSSSGNKKGKCNVKVTSRKRHVNKRITLHYFVIKYFYNYFFVIKIIFCNKILILNDCGVIGCVT